jgi:hypothetical protein
LQAFLDGMISRQKMVSACIFYFYHVVTGLIKPVTTVDCYLGELPTTIAQESGRDEISTVAAGIFAFSLRMWHCEA